MKHFLVLLACLFSLNLFAQTSFDDKVKFVPRADYGESDLQIIYRHTVTDPVLKETKEFENILLLGENVSLFMNHGAYQLLIAEDSIGQENITVRTSLELSDKFDARESTYYIVKTYADNTLLYHKFTMVGTMYYYEPLPDFKWSISSEETKEICGMKCQKATSSFRGREWEVWFAPEMKNSEGPWKFSGLPGLVLSASSKDGDHIFECTDILRNHRRIRHYDTLKLDFKTKRESFNKSLKRGLVNPSQTNAGILTTMDGQPYEIGRLFYSPEELK